MSYHFQPLTEEELNKVNLVPDGVYNFEIISSTRKHSQAGNPMAELDIKYWDEHGQMRTIKDYLVFSSHPFTLRKIKHFCDSVGLGDEYNRGELRETLYGLCGKFIIGTQEGSIIPTEKLKGKPEGSRYPDRNVVMDYEVILDGENKINKKSNNYEKIIADDKFDDDIPF